MPDMLSPVADVYDDYLTDDYPIEGCDAWQARPSGILVRRRRERVLQAVDLYCGCGGFSLGLERAGIDVVGALDNNAAAAHTYLWNLGSPRGCAVVYVDPERDPPLFFKGLRGGRGDGELEVGIGDRGWIGFNKVAIGGWGPLGTDCGCRGMVFGDAARATGQSILNAMEAAGWRGSIDLVVGGPPCQGISKTGRQKVNDPRNSHVLEFVRLAGELDATMFVMENVPPLIRSEKYRPLLGELVRRAHQHGFNVAMTVLEAAQYGVPQYRPRAFIQGVRSGVDFAFPLPTNFALVAPIGEPLQGVVPAGWRPPP